MHLYLFRKCNIFILQNNESYSNYIVTWTRVHILCMTTFIFHTGSMKSDKELSSISSVIGTVICDSVMNVCRWHATSSFISRQLFFVMGIYFVCEWEFDECGMLSDKVIIIFYENCTDTIGSCFWLAAENPNANHWWVYKLALVSPKKELEALNLIKNRTLISCNSR